MGHYTRSSISTSPHPYPSSVTATLCMSSFATSMSHFSHLCTFILKLHPHFSLPLSSANTTTISTCTLLAPDRSSWEISFWLILTQPSPFDPWLPKCFLGQDTEAQIAPDAFMSVNASECYLEST